MAQNNNGGPAFPALHSIDGNWVKEPLPEFTGMTLRDYFAAKAMAAYITHLSCGGTEGVSKHYKEVANESYGIADAMLAARNAT